MLFCQEVADELDGRPTLIRQHGIGRCCSATIGRASAEAAGFRLLLAARPPPMPRGLRLRLGLWPQPLASVSASGSASASASAPLGWVGDWLGGRLPRRVRRPRWRPHSGPSGQACRCRRSVPPARARAPRRPPRRAPAPAASGRSAVALGAAMSKRDRPRGISDADEVAGAESFAVSGLGGSGSGSGSGSAAGSTSGSAGARCRRGRRWRRASPEPPGRRSSRLNLEASSGSAGSRCRRPAGAAGFALSRRASVFGASTSEHPRARRGCRCRRDPPVAAGFASADGASGFRGSSLALLAPQPPKRPRARRPRGRTGSRRRRRSRARARRRRGAQVEQGGPPDALAAAGVGGSSVMVPGSGWRRRARARRRSPRRGRGCRFHQRRRRRRTRPPSSARVARSPFADANSICATSRTFRPPRGRHRSPAWR